MNSLRSLIDKYGSDKNKNEYRNMIIFLKY